MNKVISLFDSFRIQIPPKLKCHADGVEPVLLELLEGITLCK
jgi:hypothetical protein